MSRERHGPNALGVEYTPLKPISIGRVRPGDRDRGRQAERSRGLAEGKWNGAAVLQDYCRPEESFKILAGSELRPFHEGERDVYFTYCVRLLITSPSASRSVISRGIWPGRLWVAQPKQGS